MFIVIDLVDYENVSHALLKLKLDASSSIDELQNEVLSCFHIKIRYQQILKSDGQRIDLMTGSLRSVGIQDGETLTIKHSELLTWSLLLKMERMFQEEIMMEIKKKICEESLTYLKLLRDSNFTVVYKQFFDKFMSIEKKLLMFQDKELEAIKRSCEAYFRKNCGDHVNLAFSYREDGSNPGCICMVNDQSVISTFYVKTNHNAGSYSSNAHFDQDLRELFVYQYLQDIGIGAEILFLENESFSRWIIYIASREIPGFKTLKFIELTEPGNTNAYANKVNIMLFVYAVLMLGDHHTANMGVCSAGNPFILDFTIIGKPMTSVHDLYRKVRMSQKINEHLGTINECFPVLLEYIQQSNFITTLDKSLETFLHNQKLFFDKSQRVFQKTQKTEDLMEYIENVKRNVKLFEDYSLI